MAWRWRVSRIGAESGDRVKTTAQRANAVRNRRNTRGINSQERLSQCCAGAAARLNSRQSSDLRSRTTRYCGNFFRLLTGIAGLRVDSAAGGFGAAANSGRARTHALRGRSPNPGCHGSGGRPSILISQEPRFTPGDCCTGDHPGEPKWKSCPRCHHGHNQRLGGVSWINRLR